MKKAIAIIRTSTKAQEIESQKKEVLGWCVKDGLTLEEIEVVGKQGASAIKLDEAYKKNMERVYELIESTPSIKTVYAFAIDRIGRNEEVLMKFKNYLISKGVQLKIMNPTLVLLNEDGSVNSGVELAFSLFSTMAKQEMQQKKARFDRGKRRNAEAGIYNGGNEIKFGYTVVNKKIVIEETEANIVRMIYSMMESRKYSYFTLTKEIKDRGIKFRNKEITVKTIINLFNTKIYTGEPNGKLGTKYPIIITKELYEKVKGVIANNNRFQNKENKHSHFATKILRCNDCGTSYTAVMDNYRCYRRNLTKRFKELGEDYKICNNDISFQIKYLDGYLWQIAQKLHFDYITRKDESTKKEMEEEKEVLIQKIGELERRVEEVSGKKKEAILDSYMEALITKEERNKRLAKVAEEVQEYNSAITSHKQRIVVIDGMLNTKETTYFDREELLWGDISSATEKKMSELVHKYIVDIRLDRCVMPNVVETGNISTNEKLCGKKCIKLTITTYENRKIYLYYFSKFTTISNTWCNECEGEEIGEGTLTPDVNFKITPFPFEPIFRKGEKCYTPSLELRKELITKYKYWVRSVGVNIEEERSYILCGEGSSGGDERVEEIRELLCELQKMVIPFDSTIFIRTMNYLAEL